jgi:predicted nucleotidyltransferase component of viral defense system
MRKEIVNIPASIHDKLLNLSRSTNQLFNQLLYIFANERFLYRLSISPHKNKFILKGAMALLNLSLDHPRYTRDMDFLGFTENSVDNIVGIIREICVVEANEDGLIYDLNSISGELIKLSDEYSGVRVMFDAYLGNAVIPNLQIDVGVGDVVYPQPRDVVLPGLLDLPEAIIRVYPIEAIISEKIHALEMHGFLNSRMKDIYDIWFIASNRIIDGEILTE